MQYFQQTDRRTGTFPIEQFHVGLVRVVAASTIVYCYYLMSLIGGVLSSLEIRMYYNMTGDISWQLMAAYIDYILGCHHSLAEKLCYRCCPMFTLFIAPLVPQFAEISSLDKVGLLLSSSLGLITTQTVITSSSTEHNYVS